MGFKAWQTPPDFFTALNEEFRFTLDAAASHENALLPRYCTEKGFFINSGLTSPFFVGGTDGLEYRWEGERVFCNPPYDSSIGQWLENACEAEAVVFLLPPSVDTEWYSRLMRYFRGQSPHFVRAKYGDKYWNGFQTTDFGLYTMEGRLKFWHPALKDNHSLEDHKLLGDDIFDFSKPSVPGPAPRAGNLLAIFN